ncbi:mitochondrial mitochondrial IMS protein UPS1 [Andalucia godoyi]|uniref:Mitochondrial mitochondrial IMS protein UPS1 n=1 Tax=Andalucia godoyi TaxID=505711 RepID=A0A8K0AGK2_ANDGO|nr:mitochondrial mitochondrial IMS protein UPS1 [Andalucia godoyi]|eukprot:ANDGO_00611.mRNA.1 mitochondrial mitochondrial IMS protein UPS1
MRLWTREHVYDHSWDLVTFAHWNKYPHSKYSHVLDVAVLDQHVDVTAGTLHTTRLFQCEGNTPSFMKIFIGGSMNHAYMIEKSVVNARDRKMVLKAHNISFSNFLEIVETCTYSPHPEIQGKTLFVQEACIKAYLPTSLLKGKAEGWGIANFNKNSPKGVEVINELCNKLGKQESPQQEIEFLQAAE